jgi:ABC-type Fe3+ transport system substrate-binding protein
VVTEGEERPRHGRSDILNSRSLDSLGLDSLRLGRHRDLNRRELIQRSAAAGLAIAASPAFTERVLAGDLVAAAQREKTGLVYSIVNADTMRSVVTAFNQRYGVALEAERLTTGPMSQRVGMEFSTGTPHVDVIVSTDATFLEDAARRGWLVQDLEAPSDWAADQRTSYGVGILPIPYSLAFNSEAVKTTPHDWTALVDDKFAGQVMTIDPREAINGGPMQWYCLMQRTYGDDFLAKLAKTTTFTSSVVAGLQQVAAGARLLYAPGVNPSVIALTDRGAPLKQVFPEPTLATNTFISISKRAPHPNLARLFVQFCTAAQAQSLLNRDGFSPLPNLPGSHPLPKLAPLSAQEVAAAAPTVLKLLNLT